MNHLESYEDIMQFGLALEGKTGKETPVIQIRILRKVLADNFALSDAEDNTYCLFNRKGIADLPLLRTLLAICQKS